MPASIQLNVEAFVFNRSGTDNTPGLKVAVKPHTSSSEEMMPVIARLGSMIYTDPTR
jgi:hypothetical protein